MKILLLGGNGYIGAHFYINSKFDITSVDICLFEKDLGYSTKLNYNDYDISIFDIIICLSGHSSVPMCEYSPNRSWINNVEYFRNLCNKLSKNQKLIYASSASVYGKSKGISTELSEINFNVLNHYDLQKITIDLIANKYIGEGKSILGLRFGTVNGYSPNLRADLMINSMVKSSLDSNILKVKNTHIRRAILGIDDLTKVLDLCISTDILPGQYNLASFNSTVNKIADTVAQITNSEITKLHDDKLSYDFELSTEKFQNATGFVFSDTIESIVSKLVEIKNFDIRDNDRNFQHYIS